MRRMLLGLWLILLAEGPILAQDRDCDGLPDAVESHLGTNPDLDESLQLIIEDGLRGRDDQNVSQGIAPDVNQVFFAHVAGDRYVWKITFAEDYPLRGTVFHLYTDLDDDRNTGRQDQDWVRGVDVMYSLVDAAYSARVIAPQVRISPTIPIRYVVDRNTIYFADDVHLNTFEGKTRFRMYLLSHMKDAPSDADTTSWVYVEVPLQPGRVVPPLPYPQPTNSEAIAMPNLAQLLYRLWKDARTVRLQADNAHVTGLTPLMNGDFDSQGKGEEYATWVSPVAGRSYIALLLRDRPGLLEGLEVRVDNEPVAKMVGYGAADEDMLHYTREPVALEKGSLIQVRVANNGAPVRFGNVCLLAERPEIPPLVIENLRAWHVPNEPGERPNRIMIAWTTNRPAEATVEYSLAGPEGMRQDGVLEEKRGAVNNHFLMWPAELSGSGYHLRITCTEPNQGLYSPHRATAEYTLWRDVRRHLVHHGGELAEVSEFRVPLSVRESTSVARWAWPVSSGVPLPPRSLADPQRCRVLDASGNPIPAQFTPLAYYPDGVFVKWLLVDFLTNTQPYETASYTLVCNVDPLLVEETVRIKAAEAPSGDLPMLGEVSLPVEVDTGPLQVTLGRDGFAPFAEVMVNGMYMADADGRACGFEVTDGDGITYSSALCPPDQVLVEDSGPIRATLCIKGKLASETGNTYMRYLCRLHFYVGQPYVRVVFSLDNDVTEPVMSVLRRASVRVPAELGGSKVSYGVDGQALRGVLGDRLLQYEDNHVLIVDKEGRRADGYIIARGAGTSVAVAVRNFWQLYPKGLGVDEKGITVELLPELRGDEYAGATEDDVTKLYFWCDQGRYKIRTGVRLTTEFGVDFNPAPTELHYGRGPAWQEPLFAACSPEWYCMSGAFGAIVPRKAGKFDLYEQSLDASFASFLERRETVREYGFMNYGDWFGERNWNWGNEEYDTQWALAVNFARTGNLAMLRLAEEAEWHNADIDTTHYSRNPADVGRVWTHSVGHTGGYFPDGWKSMGGFNRGLRDTGHTYAQGHFYLYALTGERRYLETGRKVADWLAEHTTNFTYYSERNVGWPMIGLMGGYDVIGNPFYLNGAKLMADMAVWTLHPDTGGWGHWIDPSECKHNPRCWGCKSFMTGVLLHGLRMYDAAEPREDVKQAILTNADFMWGVAYIPKDKGFIYSQCKSFADKGSTWTISLIGDGLAYACLLDPERRHREVLDEATTAFMEGFGVQGFGKSFTQMTCFMPLMLGDLNKLGLTSFRASNDGG